MKNIMLVLFFASILVFNANAYPSDLPTSDENIKLGMSPTEVDTLLGVRGTCEKWIDSLAGCSYYYLNGNKFVTYFFVDNKLISTENVVTNYRDFPFDESRLPESIHRLYKKIQIAVELRESDKASEERKKKEMCLSKGKIGICQASSLGKLNFRCSTINPLVTLENLFEKYCYEYDEDNIQTTMEVRNNLDRSIKDIKFLCQQYANSGTVIKQDYTTIYEIWNPGGIFEIKVNFRRHPSFSRIECRAVSWGRI